MTVSQDDFRTGMRQLAAAVNVITAGAPGARAGMTATAVMSLTAEPPQLGVAVNRSNASHAAITAGNGFVVNVLRRDQHEIASVFAGGKGAKGEERFAYGNWRTSGRGAPVLSDSAASFECSLAQTIEFSTHTLFVGLVEAVSVLPDEQPLLFMNGTWASLVRAKSEQIAAYEAVVGEVDRALDRTMKASDSPTDQLGDFARVFIDLNAPKVDLLREFYSHENFAAADELQGVNERKRNVEDKLRALLKRGKESGEFDVDDPDMAANAIIGMLNSIHRWPRRAHQRDAELLSRGILKFVSANGKPDSRNPDA
ncbi:flavin reductase [Martelella sp. FOR1707]